MPHRRWFLLLGLLTAAVALGIACTVAFTGTSRGYGFLVWNLTLAWIPVGLAAGLRQLAIKGLPMTALLPLFVLWLLFLPNAPYLVTDLVHLGEQPVPLAADALMLTIAAFAGVMAGLLSLALVESAVRRRIGARAAGMTVALAIPLASLGVYFGRVLRWNSWDALLEPWTVLGRMLEGLRDPLMHLEALAFVCAFALFLALSYAVYRRVGARPQRRE
jgi:uncharacterized membrane protein